MAGVATSTRRFALLATAAILTAAGLAARPAHAVELRDVSGWWIAIDDTLPKHWKSGAIMPMEEVLQINPDGRVTDRVMNFWAGSHRACLENKVCSDLPQIANARLKVTANRWSFIQVVPANARLDTPSGEALVRQEAITAAANWTVTLDGDRLTLRGATPAKTRTFARVDLDRLRKLHAAMRVTSFPPKDHWRCFLANATAHDKAFAPLQAGRAYAPPDFLERYLNFAGYIGALKAAIADPAIDESNEDRRRLLAVEPEELMVAHFDGVLRPPSVEDRTRFTAVLSYIDGHARALLAHNAAVAVMAEAKTRADAAAQEAARLGAIAKSAAAVAADAQAKAKAAAGVLAQARDASNAQADVVKKTAEALRAAEAETTARQGVATMALAAHEAAQRAAAEQQRKLSALNRSAAEAQQKLETATRQADEAQRKLEAAQAAAAAQQQKADAAAVATTEQQGKVEAAQAAAGAAQQKYQAAKGKADAQQDISNKLTGASREFADGLAALQKSADDATVRLNRMTAAAGRLSETGGASDPALADAARDAADAVSTMQAALKVTVASIKMAAAARDRAQAAAGTAAALAADLTRAAQDTEAGANQASGAAKAAEAARDQAKAAADAAAKETANLLRAAQAAERAAAEAHEALRNAGIALDQAKAAVGAEARETARVTALAQSAALESSDARHAADAAAANRDLARSEANAAEKEAARRADAVQSATKVLAAADDAAKAAAQREQQAKVPADAAAELSAKAHAELQQASATANAALEAMQTLAASQPRTENLPVITTADIATFAQVLGESDAAKRLFCRGNYTVGSSEPDAAEPDAATAATMSIGTRPSEPPKTEAPRTEAPKAETPAPALQAAARADGGPRAQPRGPGVGGRARGRAGLGGVHAQTSSTAPVTAAQIVATSSSVLT